MTKNSNIENPNCPCTWDCPRHGKCSARSLRFVKKRKK